MSRALTPDRLAIRVISLAESDRRPRMAAQLDPLGLDWRFFDACTALPPVLSYSPERARIVRGRKLTKGELGCFASHWSLWRWLMDSPAHDWLLVLEDDLLIDPVFFADLHRVVGALGSLPYLRLYAKVPFEMRREGSFLERHIARFGGYAYGTQGYFINKQGADRFLRSITRVERPIDDEMDRYWAHGVPIRAIFPFPIIEVQYGSTIENTRRDLEPLHGADRARRLAIRASEKLRRRLAKLTSRLHH